MSTTQQPSLVVFGATGGCAANALAANLRAGLKCVAMVRTPAKLRSMLEIQHKISSELLDTHAMIVQGNIKSQNDVKHALTVTGRLPDRILFAVGGVARLQLSLWSPVSLDDPHICEDGMKTVISALSSCRDEDISLGRLGKRPALIVISTISMSSRRDLPYSLYPLEYWLLSIPRNDKKAMERVVFDAAYDADDSPFSDFAMVRPPLLTEGQPIGLDKVRVGWVWPDEAPRDELPGSQEETGSPLGFTITKADVGRWIFEKLIQGDESSFGKCWYLSS